MTRRTALGLYALIFLETVVWVALVPLAPTYARELDLSRLETGAVLAAASFATLVVAFPVGVIADRFGARAVTLASALLFVASTAGQGLAGDFWTLMLTRTAYGVALGAVWTAGVAWLADAARGSQARAVGATVTVSGLGFAVGPAFAGLVADRFGTAAPFYACAAAGVLALAVLAPRGDAPIRFVERQSIRRTLARVRGDALVLASLAMIAMLGFSSGGINLLVPLHLKANGVSAGRIGHVFSAGAAVFTRVSAIVVRRSERAATVRVGGACTLGLALTLLIVVVSGSSAAAVAFVLIRAPFWGAIDTILYPLGTAGAERAAIGRGAVLGLVNLVWGIAATVGPLTAGAVSDAAGERAAYLMLVAACALTAAWILRAARPTRASNTVLLAEGEASR